MRIEADWIEAAHSRAVMQALGGRGYFVGGCVRNALLGAPVADVDIATPLPPDAVLERLQSHSVKAIPTGLKHGTITALHQGVPVEITTFRRDVETDGRHATVAFTANIAQDAARRDFTMNALYADAFGNLVDPLGGLSDLEARHVRFIGKPQDRIREDYLRILRFFRFHAWYGAAGIDPEGLAACTELAEGLDRLARERVGWEIRKLLSAPDPAPAVASMASTGILIRCLPGAVSEVLPVLIHLEESQGLEPDWMRRLASLAGEGSSEALRLSKVEDRTLKSLHQAIRTLQPDAVTAYRHGVDIARSAALVRAASTGAELPPSLAHDLQFGASQRMPLTAKHLTDRGVQAGPELGRLLQEAEARWISSGFVLDKNELMAQGIK